METDQTLVTTISTGAGAALSLLLAYVPGVKDRWAKLAGDQKRLWLFFLLAAVSILIAVVNCANINTGIAGITVGCTQDGLTKIAINFCAAVVGNQAAYTALPSDRK